MHKKNHFLWMIVGCVFPLLLIFILSPLLGLDSTWGIFIVIVAMFACHLMMLKHHGGGHNHHKENSEINKLGEKQ